MYREFFLELPILKRSYREFDGNQIRFPCINWNFCNRNLLVWYWNNLYWIAKKGNQSGSIAVFKSLKIKARKTKS